MIEVTRGIHRLGGKRHNFYLVAEGGRATVIDSGGSRELPALESGLASLGLGLDAVEAILITHAHTDHIGFARRASERGISVRAHEGEVGYVRDRSQGSQIGPRDVPLWSPRIWLFLAEMIRSGAERGYPVPNVEAVRDGEVLDLPGRPRVVATPGHTAGHASYYLEDRKVVFSGDALVTMDLLSRSRGPLLLPEVFHHDAALAAESLDRLEALDAEVLLPGHGDVWHGDVAEAVAAAR